jgi:hypothetical protein
MADLRDLEARLTACNPGLLAWLRSPQADNDWRVQHLPLVSARRDLCVHQGRALQIRVPTEQDLSFPTLHGSTVRRAGATLAATA